MLPLNEWLFVVSELEAAIGIPLLVGGIGLMIFGARLSRVSVMLVYGVLGLALAAWLLGPHHTTWWALALSAALPGAVSFRIADKATPVLGGLVMGGLTVFAFRGVGFSPSALCAIGLFSLIAFTAFSYLHRDHVLIGVTAVLGSMLVVSGMAVWISAFPGIYGHLRSLALGSMFVAPFILLVPTIASCFYQAGYMHRRLSQ